MVSEGKVTKNVKRKLFNYYEQACKLDVDAILHQCVIAGNVALELNDYFDVPIVRIDEGMLRKALATSNNIAIFATVKAAMSQSVAYLKMLADQEQKSINIKEYLVTKDDIAVQAKNASDNNEIIVLAQPSMTSFLPLLEAENIHALSAPESGIEYLAKILDSKQ